MIADFFELFALCFLIVAVGYGVLAGCTGLLYRKRSVGQLRGDELRIKQGTASLEHRLNVAVKTFFTSIFTYQVYLLAVTMSGIIYAAVILLKR